MVLQCIAVYCMVLHGIAWYCMVLYYHAQSCTILHHLAPSSPSCTISHHLAPSGTIMHLRYTCIQQRQQTSPVIAFDTAVVAQKVLYNGRNAKSEKVGAGSLVGRDAY